MRNYRIILYFLLVLLCPIVRAQSLSVESFQLLENDLTANTYGTMERDQNGDVAALIRVVTPETGFSFDAGMLGVVRTVQKTGEIWVYVPYGLQRITIAHQELGVLRNYYFPVPIERARTYELILKSDRIKDEYIHKNITVTFRNPNSKSDLYLEGSLLGSGTVKARVLTMTNYFIEAKKEGYKTYSDTIIFGQDEDGKVIEIPVLKPLTGTLQLNSQPSGAKVTIDEIQVGETPLKIEGLSLGVKELIISKKGYHNYYTNVTITDDRIYTIDALLDEKKYLGKNGVYFGAGYQVGHLMGVVGYAGLYIRNINIEANYLMPNANPETTYWNTSVESWKGVSSQLAYDYIPTNAIGGSLGYGVLRGKHMRITPQAGAMYYMLQGTFMASKSNNYLVFVDADAKKSSTYVISGRCALRLDLCPINHISISVTPSYEKPIKMGSLATRIHEKSDIVKRWCGGFAVNAGLAISF